LAVLDPVAPCLVAGLDPKLTPLVAPDQAVDRALDRDRRPDGLAGGGVEDADRARVGRDGDPVLARGDEGPAMRVLPLRQDLAGGDLQERPAAVVGVGEQRPTPGQQIKPERLGPRLLTGGRRDLYLDGADRAGMGVDQSDYAVGRRQGEDIPLRAVVGAEEEL